jgi:hypothetical protein
MRQVTLTVTVGTPVFMSTTADTMVGLEMRSGSSCASAAVGTARDNSSAAHSTVTVRHRNITSPLLRERFGTRLSH